MYFVGTYFFIKRENLCFFNFWNLNRVNFETEKLLFKPDWPSTCGSCKTSRAKAKVSTSWSTRLEMRRSGRPWTRSRTLGKSISSRDIDWLTSSLFTKMIWRDSRRSEQLLIHRQLFYTWTKIHHSKKDFLFDHKILKIVFSGGWWLVPLWITRTSRTDQDHWTGKSWQKHSYQWSGNNKTKIFNRSLSNNK